MNTNTPNNQGFPPPSNGWVPPAPQPPKGQNNGGREFFDAIRRSGYFRSQSRWVGGVAGGLARRLNVDPLVVRAGFVLLGIVFTGLALVLYAIAWALLPEEADGRIHTEEALKGNFDGALIVIILGITIGFSSMGAGIFGFDFLPGPIAAIFWLAFLAALGYVGYLIYQQHSSNQNKNHDSAPHHNGQASAFTGQNQGNSTSGQWNQGAQGDAGQSNGSGGQGTAPHGGNASGTQAAGSQGAPHSGQSGTSGYTGYGQAGYSQNGKQSAHGYTNSAGAGGNYYNAASANSYNAYQTNGYPANGQNQYQWTPPQPPAVQKVKGNGVGQFALLAGLLLLAGAGLMAADQYGSLNLSVPIIALIIGVGVVLGGIAIIINGIRGASSGAAGLFSVFGLITVVFVATPILFGFNVTDDNFDSISDRSLAPTSVAELQNDLSFGVGDLTVDLTSMNVAELAAAAEAPEISISGGLGEITVIYPESLEVTATTKVGMGDYTDPFQSVSGVGSNAISLTQDHDGNTISDPDITFDVNLGVGSVSFTSVSENN